MTLCKHVINMFEISKLFECDKPMVSYDKLTISLDELPIMSSDMKVIGRTHRITDIIKTYKPGIAIGAAKDAYGQLKDCAKNFWYTGSFFR